MAWLVGIGLLIVNELYCAELVVSLLVCGVNGCNGIVGLGLCVDWG